MSKRRFKGMSRVDRLAELEFSKEIYKVLARKDATYLATRRRNRRALALCVLGLVFVALLGWGLQ